MNIEIKELPEIAIIGKEGFCSEGNNIVGELWEMANSHFNEVTSLAAKNQDGTFAGFWGAMSDETMSFLPWTNNFTKGYYLAGVEVTREKEAPAGWTKWILPARKYLIAEVPEGKYGEIFSEVIQKTIPEMGLKLSGAVCDFTEPSDGKNKLYFPVK